LQIKNWRRGKYNVNNNKNRLGPLQTWSLKRGCMGQATEIGQVQQFYRWGMHTACKITYSSQCTLMKNETATVHAIHLPICRGNGTVRSFKKNDVVKGNELVVSSLLTAPHKEIADKPS